MIMEFVACTRGGFTVELINHSVAENSCANKWSKHDGFPFNYTHTNTLTNCAFYAAAREFVCACVCFKHRAKSVRQQKENNTNENVFLLAQHLSNTFL